MRLICVIVTLAFCALVVVEAKPTWAVKVVPVPVPVIVPKINILGILGKVVHAKAALIGKVLHAKAAVVGSVLGAKATLIGHLLGSSSGPVIGVVKPLPAPALPEPIYPKPLPLPPSTSYATPE